MSLKQQMTEPWGILTAALLGGLGGAVTAALGPAVLLGLPVGAAIAATVYGVKVGLGALTDRGTPARPPATALPEPPRGSQADGWLRRARAALLMLQQQTNSPPDPVLRSQVDDVDDRAAAVVEDLRRLGGQVTIVEQAMNRVDAAGLQRAAQRLRQEARGSSGALHDEKQRAVRAVEDQLAVYERLAGVRQGQLARMESAVLGLEGLAARLAELLALHLSTDTPGGATASIGELTDEIDGLRAGLAETEELSRKVLARESPARDTGATPTAGAV